jgi:hypothetical protein
LVQIADVTGMGDLMDVMGAWQLRLVKKTAGLI